MPALSQPKGAPTLLVGCRFLCTLADALGRVFLKADPELFQFGNHWPLFLKLARRSLNSTDPAIHAKVSKRLRERERHQSMPATIKQQGGWSDRKRGGSQASGKGTRCINTTAQHSLWSAAIYATRVLRNDSVELFSGVVGRPSIFCLAFSDAHVLTRLCGRITRLSARLHASTTLMSTRTQQDRKQLLSPPLSPSTTLTGMDVRNSPPTSVFRDTLTERMSRRRRASIGRL